MSVPRQVLIVEDDAFLCGMLAEVLEGRGFVVHQAHTADEALVLIHEIDPDALIVDLDLGEGPSGIEVIGSLGDRIDQFGVLVLSNYPTASAVVPHASLPASVGYVFKRRLSDTNELIAALEAVLRNVDPPGTGLGQAVPAELAALTPKQLELLRLIALGYSNEMIAAQRGVTRRSVETLVTRLFHALGLSGDARSNARVKAAMLYAQVMGIPRTRP